MPSTVWGPRTGSCHSLLTQAAPQTSVQDQGPYAQLEPSLSRYSVQFQSTQRAPMLRVALWFAHMRCRGQRHLRVRTGKAMVLRGHCRCQWLRVGPEAACWAEGLSQPVFLLSRQCQAWLLSLHSKGESEEAAQWLSAGSLWALSSQLLPSKPEQDSAAQTPPIRG